MSENPELDLWPIQPYMEKCPNGLVFLKRYAEGSTEK
jgi:hypothetical protein